MASINTLANPALPARVNRNPKHPFMLAHKPYQLQPFLCAPVLAGETMKNLLVQSRAVSDPILNPLAGWWLEYYFFYVKLTDLHARDILQTMIIDPENADVSSLRLAAVEPWSYSAEGAIPWSKLCLQRVVEEYFRNPGETWDTAAIDSVPLRARAEDRDNVWQSLLMVDELATMDVEISTAGDNAFTMAELDGARRDYELLKMHGLANMTWSDYLQMQGVNQGVAEEPHRPELLRHVREWAYPANTIDPANGTPRSAMSWSVAERADKNRFFKEPGFILGITCAMPKTFLRSQVASAAGFMQDAAKWFPMALADDAWSAMQSHVTTSDSGPLPGITDAEGYAWDMRDLLTYGEQFMNFAPAAATGKNLVDLPASTTQKDYVDADDINSLFVGATDATRTIRQDGVVHLTIAGRQRDLTPPGSTGTIVA